MDIRNRRGWSVRIATLATAAAIGVGATLASGDEDAPAAPVTGATATGALDEECVLGIDLTRFRGPDSPLWLAGLMARGDATNRRLHLGRFAPDGECADTPAWYRALVLRSDALNRAARLGRYGYGDGPTR